MSAGWISGDERTIVDLLHARLESDPDGPYLDVTGTPATAAEVAEGAGRLAGALIALGVEPGDRVATLIENSPPAMLAWWGAVLAGAVQGVASSNDVAMRALAYYRGYKNGRRSFSSV